MTTTNSAIKRWTDKIPSEQTPADASKPYTEIGILDTLSKEEIKNYVLIPFVHEDQPTGEYELKDLDEAIDWYADDITKKTFLRELSNRLESGSIEPEEINSLLRGGE